jgi:hypothetical protein
MAIWLSAARPSPRSNASVPKLTSERYVKLNRESSVAEHAIGLHDWTSSLVQVHYDETARRSYLWSGFPCLELFDRCLRSTHRMKETSNDVCYAEPSSILVRCYFFQVSREFMHAMYATSLQPALAFD